MPQAILDHQNAIRLGLFAAVLLAMAVWEVLAPRRPQEIGRSRRWPNNLAIVFVDSALVRLFFPTTAIALALLAAERGWGMLNFAKCPLWLAVPVSVLILDLAIYGQHVLFHAFAPFWRLHRMHHADLEFDVTTGVRFHPIEIVLSMAIKFAVIVVVGAPALGVLAFEVLLNATSMFNHGNVSLPARLDRALRLVVVTPEMHRVHHSVIPRETNSNFGFNLPWWDRLFGTYRAEPEAGHQAMTIGLPIFRDSRELRLDRLVTQPFRDDGHPPMDATGGPR
jgi:sterol desaturase/sphingolipid hydroxylase (fatty acid hydroxylase superfamily)